MSQVVKNTQPQVGGNHYDKYQIEPIEAMRDWLTPEEFRGFLRSSALYYQIRYRDKNGIEDLKKAQWFLNELVDFEQSLLSVENDDRL